MGARALRKKNCHFPDHHHNLLLERLKVRRVFTLDSLVECVSELRVLVGLNDLVVVDSVAGVARGAEADVGLVTRQQMLVTLAQGLKGLGSMVLVVNQVSESLSEGRTVAALGATWSHCVNLRLMLTMDQSTGERRVEVAKSSFSKCGHGGKFCLTVRGFEDVSSDSIEV